MKPDPTLDAIREVRHQISLSINHDARKLVEYYRKLQERHPDKVISLGSVVSTSKDKNVA